MVFNIIRLHRPHPTELATNITIYESPLMVTTLYLIIWPQFSVDKIEPVFYVAAAQTLIMLWFIPFTNCKEEMPFVCILQDFEKNEI